MKLKELLGNIKYGEMTEEELLDLEVKIITEANSGTYKVNCGIKEVRVEQQMVYSNVQHKMVPKEKDGKPYIFLETSMIP